MLICHELITKTSIEKKITIYDTILLFKRIQKKKV